MLDDPVTAQYTHNLTVTGRLGGLYTCTVANDKPSQDSAQFNVQGICILVVIKHGIQVLINFMELINNLNRVTFITRYGSTLYIGIA